MPRFISQVLVAASALIFILTLAFNTPILAANVSLTASPSGSAIANGANFTVDLIINSDVPVRGWQAQVNFTVTGMQCTGISEGSFLPDFAASIGNTVISYGSPVIDNNIGQLTNINYAIVGQNTGGVTGNGTLCTLSFTAKPEVNARCAITPAAVILIDNNPDKPAAIPDVTINPCSLIIGTLPSPTSTIPSGGFPGGGSGGVTSTTTLVPQGFASSAPLTMDNSGKIQSTAELKTTDDKLKLEIAQNTQLHNSAGNPLTSLSISALNSVANLPSGSALVLAYTFGPDGATFAPALTLKITYNPNSLPANVAENTLHIAYSQGAAWEALTSSIDRQAHTVSAPVSHLSSYALLGTIAPPPASTPSPTSAADVTPTPTLSQTPTPEPSLTPTITEPSSSVPIITTSTLETVTTPSPPAPSSSSPVSSSPPLPGSSTAAGTTSLNWWLVAGAIIAFGAVLALVILLIRRPPSSGKS